MDALDRRGWRPFSLAQKREFAKSKREEELKTVLFDTDKVAKMSSKFNETVQKQVRELARLKGVLNG